MMCNVSTRVKPKSPVYDTFILQKDSHSLNECRVKDITWLLAKSTVHYSVSQEKVTGTVMIQ